MINCLHHFEILTNSSEKLLNYFIKGFKFNLVNKINLDNLLSFKSSDDDFFKSEKTTSINLYDKWDLLLEECWLNRSNQWSQSKYDEKKFNCFDFVINFLNDFGYFDMNEEDSQDRKLKHLLSTAKPNEPNQRLHRYLKEKITNDLIESEFVKFLKYLNLLVKLRKQKFLIENIKVN